MRSFGFKVKSLSRRSMASDPKFPALLLVFDSLFIFSFRIRGLGGWFPHRDQFFNEVTWFARSEKEVASHSRPHGKVCGVPCITTSGQFSGFGEPQKEKTLSIWSRSLLPFIMFSPTRSSQNMQPTDQTSMAGPYSLSPRRISGHRYHSVTTVGL